MEVLREGSQSSPDISSGGSFNPCFNGSVERGYISFHHAISVERVSILVLMEVLREGQIDGRRIHPPGRVSILVLMEVLREGSIQFSRCHGSGLVSILVLMEVLREGTKNFMIP